jgi:tripartite-type tricarboxylate transporter receptor subunit TctC
MVHVPYRGGGAAMADLLSGQLQVYIGAITSSLEYVKANRLRALAVSTATRSEALPEVARVSDFVPGFETSDWGGISGPKGTPAEIIHKLNEEINAGLADPKVKARLADLGGTPLTGSPTDFEAFIAAETEKWAKVVKFAGIKPN